MKLFTKFSLFVLAVLLCFPVVVFAGEGTPINIEGLFFDKTAEEVREAHSDIPEGSDGDALVKAIQKGLINGYNGSVRPYDTLTRAELAAIVVRAFDATEKADISQFTDVPVDAWYYEDIAKAVALGVMKGDGNGIMRPEDTVTRQEAFVMLARVYKLNEASGVTIKKFADGTSVADWAKGPTEALLLNKYLKVSDGYIRPTEAIKRIEFAEIIVVMEEDSVNYKLYTSDEGWSPWV